MTIHYDLYQLQEDGGWDRIYSNQSLHTARANLSLELMEPTQKDRWMVKRVETSVKEFIVDLKKR